MVSPSRTEITVSVKSAAMAWETTRDTKRREHDRERRVENDGAFFGRLGCRR